MKMNHLMLIGQVNSVEENMYGHEYRKKNK